MRYRRKGKEIAVREMSPAPKVRRMSRAGVDTRKKLLDSAEHLFGRDGYDGASLRDIAEAAETNLALCTYHFGTKEQLFEAVVRRRAVDLERARLNSLAKIKAQPSDPSDTVRKLIEGYVNPMLRPERGKVKRMRAYVRMISHMINIDRWTPVIREYYSECAQAYLDEWFRILPDKNQETLLNVFSFMASTMLYLASYTERYHLVAWDKRPDRLRFREREIEDFINYSHIGFMSL